MMLRQDICIFSCCQSFKVTPVSLGPEGEADRAPKSQVLILYSFSWSQELANDPPKFLSLLKHRSKGQKPRPTGSGQNEGVCGLDRIFLGSHRTLKHTSISSISPRLRRRGVVRPLHVAHGQRRVPASGSSIGDPSQERFDNRAGGWK